MALLRYEVPMRLIRELMASETWVSLQVLKMRCARSMFLNMPPSMFIRGLLLTRRASHQDTVFSAKHTRAHEEKSMPRGREQDIQKGDLGVPGLHAAQGDENAHRVEGELVHNEATGFRGWQLGAGVEPDRAASGRAKKLSRKLFQEQTEGEVEERGKEARTAQRTAQDPAPVQDPGNWWQS